MSLWVRGSVFFSELEVTVSFPSSFIVSLQCGFYSSFSWCNLDWLQQRGYLPPQTGPLSVWSLLSLLLKDREQSCCVCVCVCSSWPPDWHTNPITYQRSRAYRPITLRSIGGCVVVLLLMASLIETYGNLVRVSLYRGSTEWTLSVSLSSWLHLYLPHMGCVRLLLIV